MKKIILAMVLTLTSSAVMAEWEYVTERDEYVIFSDPDFLEVKGNIARDWAKNWFLTDWKWILQADG